MGYCILTENHRTEYEVFGVTAVRGVFSPAQSAEILREIENIRNASSPFRITHRDFGDPGSSKIDVFLSGRSEYVRNLALKSRLAEVARHILRAEAESHYFFYDQLFVKDPFTSTRTQWHQDLPYWPVDGESIPSLWLALSPVDEASSAVQYLVGSHKKNIHYAAVNHEDREGARAMGQLVCPEFHLSSAAQRIVSFSLSPGDVVVHHPLIVHGAGPNHSSKTRTAISFRYCGPDVTWCPSKEAMAFPGSENISAGVRFDEQSFFPRITV